MKGEGRWEILAATRCIISNGSADRLPDYRHGCRVCPTIPSFETNVVLSLAFQSGAAGSFAMSCASYLGSGHRLEFYGEDGTLVLANPTADYMRGFIVSHARRPTAARCPSRLRTIRSIGNFQTKGGSRRCRDWPAASSMPSSSASL